MKTQYDDTLSIEQFKFFSPSDSDIISVIIEGTISVEKIGKLQNYFDGKKVAAIIFQNLIIEEDLVGNKAEEKALAQSLITLIQENSNSLRGLVINNINLDNDDLYALLQNLNLQNLTISGHDFDTKNANLLISLVANNKLNNSLALNCSTLSEGKYLELLEKIATSSIKDLDISALKLNYENENGDLERIVYDSPEEEEQILSDRHSATYEALKGSNILKLTLIKDWGMDNPLNFANLIEFLNNHSLIQLEIFGIGNGSDHELFPNLQEAIYNSNTLVTSGSIDMSSYNDFSSRQSDLRELGNFVYNLKHSLDLGYSNTIFDYVNSFENFHNLLNLMTVFNKNMVELYDGRHDFDTSSFDKLSQFAIKNALYLNNICTAGNQHFSTKTEVLRDSSFLIMLPCEIREYIFKLAAGNGHYFTNHSPQIEEVLDGIEVTGDTVTDIID